MTTSGHFVSQHVLVWEEDEEDQILAHGLHQLVTSPTRGTNILLTNDPSTVINIEILPEISDNEIVSAVTSIVPRLLKLNKRKLYLYNKVYWDKIRSELESMVTSLLLIDNVNDKWESFKRCCLLLRDKHVPSRISKSRSGLPWVTISIKKLIKARNKLFFQCQLL